MIFNTQNGRNYRREHQKNGPVLYSIDDTEVVCVRVCESMFRVNGQHIYIHIFVCGCRMCVTMTKRGELYMFLRGAFDDTLCACSVQLRYI